MPYNSETGKEALNMFDSKIPEPIKDDILDYFKEPDARECYTFESFAGFLWQVGKFTESIYYIQKLYESCVKTLGTASMDTGFVAKTAGANKFQLFYKVGIPSALPMVFTGMRHFKH